MYPKPILEPINKGAENVLAIMQSRIVTQDSLNFFRLEPMQELENFNEELENESLGDKYPQEEEK